MLIKTMDQLLIGPITWMYRLFLRDNEAIAALRTLSIVGDETWPWKIILSQIGQMSCKDDAVCYNRLPDTNRCKQVLILTGHS